MKAVVLAAGEGRRMGRGVPKAVVRLLGLTLLERSVLTLREAGVDEIVVVSGFKGQLLQSLAAERSLAIEVVENGDYEEGSATSVLAAKGRVGDRFLVVMADHLFETSVIRGLLNARGCFVAAIDSKPRYVDIPEATKVVFFDGRVKRIGKDLTEFNGVDAGAFICAAEVFPVIERCVDEGKGSWNDVKRKWMEGLEREIDVFDLKGAFWLDIDTEENLKRASRLLVQRLRKARDGFISKWLNRKLSLPLTRLLVRTKLTPNQISLMAFFAAIVAGALFSLGSYPLVGLGGIIAQVSSVFDGCDGEVARLKHASSHFGGWFDAVLDRIADAIIITGMTYGLFSATGEELVWILGAAALSGSFLVSYSEARYESASERKIPWSGARVAAKRDARLFVVMLGGLFDQVLLALLAISLWGTVEIVRRLWYGGRENWGTPGSSTTVAQRKGGKQTGRAWPV